MERSRRAALTETVDILAANEWQWRDCDGTVMPWYTLPMLEVLRTWTPLGRVCEFGGGASSIWYALHARGVVTIESNPVWAKAIRREADRRRLGNLLVIERPAERCAAAIEEQAGEAEFDLIIVDGPIRGAALRRALPYVAPGGRIILDNAHLFSPEAPDALDVHNARIWRMLEPNPCHVYRQPGHPYWTTAYWDIRYREQRVLAPEEVYADHRRREAAFRPAGGEPMR